MAGKGLSYKGVVDKFVAGITVVVSNPIFLGFMSLISFATFVFLIVELGKQKTKIDGLESNFSLVDLCGSDALEVVVGAEVDSLGVKASFAEISLLVFFLSLLRLAAVFHVRKSKVAPSLNSDPEQLELGLKSEQIQKAADSYVYGSLIRSLFPVLVLTAVVSSCIYAALLHKSEEDLSNIGLLVEELLDGHAGPSGSGDSSGSDSGYSSFDGGDVEVRIKCAGLKGLLFGLWLSHAFRVASVSTVTVFAVYYQQLLGEEGKPTVSEVSEQRHKEHKNKLINRRVSVKLVDTEKDVDVLRREVASVLAKLKELQAERELNDVVDDVDSLSSKSSFVSSSPVSVDGGGGASSGNTSTFRMRPGSSNESCSNSSNESSPGSSRKPSPVAMGSSPSKEVSPVERSSEMRGESANSVADTDAPSLFSSPASVGLGGERCHISLLQNRGGESAVRSLLLDYSDSEGSQSSSPYSGKEGGSCWASFYRERYGCF